MGRVGVLQMCSSACVADNLREVRDAFVSAQTAGVELLLLPENFAFMGKKEQGQYGVAEDDGRGIIQDTLSQWARSFGIWVIAGTIPIKMPTLPPHRVLARSMVYNHQGERVAFYDKIHLFDARVSNDETHQESSSIAPGHRVVVVDTPIGCVGLSVCYDLRFPELYRRLVSLGAEVLVVPSAFTAVTGAAHWDVLLRARAIENLSYIIAANQGGLHENGRHTHGHSMMVEPWGAIMQEKKTDTGLLVADIDLIHLRTLRHAFPCNEHHVLGA